MTPLSRTPHISLGQFLLEQGRIYHKTVKKIQNLKNDLNIYLRNHFSVKHIQGFSDNDKYELPPQDHSIPKKSSIHAELDGIFQDDEKLQKLTETYKKLVTVIETPEKVFTFYYTLETMRFLLICGVIILIATAILAYLKFEHSMVLSFPIHLLGISGVIIVCPTFIIRKCFKDKAPQFEIEFEKLWVEIMKVQEASDEDIADSIHVEDDEQIFYTLIPKKVFLVGQEHWKCEERDLTEAEKNTATRIIFGSSNNNKSGYFHDSDQDS